MFDRRKKTSWRSSRIDFISCSELSPNLLASLATVVGKASRYQMTKEVRIAIRYQRHTKGQSNSASKTWNSVAAKHNVMVSAFLNKRFGDCVKTRLITCSTKICQSFFYHSKTFIFMDRNCIIRCLRTDFLFVLQMPFCIKKKHSLFLLIEHKMNYREAATSTHRSTEAIQLQSRGSTGDRFWV